ncbi:MAG: desulfoferrodoxin [Candidatus Aenigmarchaeota archaeon]|nr:desulfoferrodoxin [Candidatus Aenigmarchaeota archaeon]
MTEINQVYKCEICGNIVDVLYAGAGELVCCGQPMNLLEEKTTNEGQEKHVPVVEKTENGLNVRVGSVQHPMEEGHYIQWIQVLSNGKSCRKFLKAGDVPKAEFDVLLESADAVRAYCNVHGIWKA